MQIKNILHYVKGGTGVKRIITNTGITYFKTAVSFFIGVFTTRIILQALGASDFGLYSLLAGMVGFLAFLNGSLSVATQRFLSFQLGKGNKAETQLIFNASVFLHFLAGIIVVIIIEAVGGYALHNLLNFDSSRVGAAEFILHCMAITVFISILTTPYDAVIYAHENFLIDALLGIPDSVLRLLLALYLQESSFDRLKIYGFGLATLMILQRIIRQIYCRRYNETKGSNMFHLDKKILLEMANFTVWTLLGGLLYAARYQGMPIIMNMFFGTIMNAAYGIANQVNGQIQYISATLMRTMNPQLMKQQGAGAEQKAHNIAIMGCKYSFILFAIVAIPIFIKIDDILVLWLKNPPQETSFFCRIIILLSLIRQLTVGIHSLIQAKGRVKWFEITVNGILFLNIPISYLILKLTNSIHLVFYIAVALNVLLWLVEVVFAKFLTSVSLKNYLYHTLGQLTLPTIAAIIAGIATQDLIVNAMINVLFVSISSICCFVTMLYFIGLDFKEKEIVNKIFFRILLLVRRIVSERVV